MNNKLNPWFGSISGLVCAMALWHGVPSAQAQMAAPEPLVITAVTANTVGLAWNDIYDDEGGFVLTRSDDFGSLSPR
jgi:hypothetical protein